jgi:histidine phosphotransferase ChpT
MGSQDLAAAVASRICHDLVSPVGAVVNGVDLLRETGPVGLAETADMIGQSAGRASALLQFYRVAFGAAGGDAQPVGRGALRDLASVLAHPPRILLEWGDDGPPMSRAEARLVGLLVLCARSVTGMRGVISIRPGAAAAFPLEVTVEAETFASTLEATALLESGPAGAPLSPRAVEFVLAQQAADAMGVPLRVGREPGRLIVTAG